ncbi:MAG TPA: MFS transporter, partial [Candidatus Saccharimonadales bacterium]|nr:MFS transporter [Candidatus Saccharimonadales bacterium]
YRDVLASACFNIRASVVLYASLGFIASFALSLGTVTWVFLSEIFPDGYRGVAVSLVGFWNTAVNMGVAFVFPWELSHLGPDGTFLGCGIFALAALIFIAACLPETKGKSLEELEDILVRSPLKTYAIPTHATD